VIVDELCLIDSMATARPLTKVWDEDDLTALVVWLDVCRQCDEGIKFVQTVTDYLFNARKKQFTYRQVQSKLQTLARTNQPPCEKKTSQSMTLHQIISGGTSLLFPRLAKLGLRPEELQQKVDDCLAKQDLHKSTKTAEALALDVSFTLSVFFVFVFVFCFCFLFLGFS